MSHKTRWARSAMSNIGRAMDDSVHESMCIDDHLTTECDLLFSLKYTGLLFIRSFRYFDVYSN